VLVPTASQAGDFSYAYALTFGNSFSPNKSRCRESESATARLPVEKHFSFFSGQKFYFMIAVGLHNYTT